MTTRDAKDLAKRILVEEQMAERARQTAQEAQRCATAATRVAERHAALAGYLRELQALWQAGPPVITGTLCGPSVEEVNRALLEGSLLLTQSGLPVVERRPVAAPLHAVPVPPGWHPASGDSAPQPPAAPGASPAFVPLQVGERVVADGPQWGAGSVYMSQRGARGTVTARDSLDAFAPAVRVQWDNGEDTYAQDNPSCQRLRRLTPAEQAEAAPASGPPTVPQDAEVVWMCPGGSAPAGYSEAVCCGCRLYERASDALWFWGVDAGSGAGASGYAHTQAGARATAVAWARQHPVQP